MSVTRFQPDLRDIRFVLFEQLRVPERLQAFPRFADLDRDTCEALIDQAAELARDLVAPINAPGDRQGCRLDAEGNVRTPDGYKAAWDALAEGGWFALTASPEYGGMGLPHTIDAVVNEVFTSASMAFAMYPGLTKAAANLLAEHGSSEQRALLVPRMYSGQWAGTMCLTEAGAGTSVGDARTRAIPQGDGSYLLEGEKVFISSGDHDLAENIIHLVLARLPGAPSGTRGISLFMVPKFLFDADGRLGERNGAIVESIEHKMGINGSATCVLGLGARKPCRGWLVGSENEGMKLMFHMMNEARIGVGIQGLASAAAAYGYARAYARERVQGQPLESFGKADVASVAIVEHPDVRRMLMTQKVLVETMRSLAYTVALAHDEAIATEDEERRKALLKKVELLTPIVKAHLSDMGYQVCTLALQTFGGYGYIQEYPVEQLVRDTKITSIYEGTNGVQAMDLLGRKMRMDGGGVFMAWLQEVGEDIARARELPELAPLAQDLEKAVNHLGASAMHLGTLGMERNLRGAMLQATPFLEQFGTVALGRHALNQARVALACLAEGASEADARFYRGKVHNARFYMAQILPRSISLAKTIQSRDESCLDPELFAGEGA